LVDGVVFDDVVEVFVVVEDGAEEDVSATVPAVIRADAGEVMTEETDPVISVISAGSVIWY
jgi:hypothetical protein